MHLSLHLCVPSAFMSFCLQVEAIIRPHLVAENLSPRAEIDMALREDLEQEEEVSVVQVVREGKTWAWQRKR